MPTPNHSQQPARRKIAAYSLLIIGLALSARLIFGEALFSSRSVTINHSSKQTTTLASLEPADNKPTAASTRPIESIRVGDRVLSSNPEISDEERSQWQEPDWNDWLHLTLKMPLSAGEGDEDPAILEIEIIRPEQWLIDQVGLVLEPRDEEPIVEPPAEFTANFTVELDDADEDASVPLSPLRDAYRFLAYAGALAELDNLELLGLTVEINLPEMGAVGTAFVQEIQPCPPVKSAPGQVVTATFKHPPANQVLDVVFAGESEAIGVTDNHLFWSDDRQAFIAIGQMELGERVVTFHGDTKRIESRLPRPGPQLVYNLEVYGEHVYYVGDQGLLVHNAYSRGKQAGDSGAENNTASKTTTFGEGRARGVPHIPLSQGDIDQYRYFKNRPGDNLAGHEIWQSANTSAFGIGGRTGVIGGKNPALALSTADHKIINRIQSQMIPNPRSMTPLENIRSNLNVLREAQRRGVRISDAQIKEAGRKAVRFYQRVLSEGLLK